MPVCIATEQKFYKIVLKKQTAQYKFNLKEMRDARRMFISYHRQDLERIISTAFKIDIV